MVVVVAVVVAVVDGLAQLRYVKEECLNALASEYRRQGKPMQANYLNEAQVVRTVAEMMSQQNDGGLAPLEGDRGAGGEMEPSGTPDGTDAIIWYIVNQSEIHGDWVLNAWNVETCELLASATLPPLEEVVTIEDSSGYQVVVDQGICYVFAHGMDEVMPCAQFLEEHGASGSGGDAELEPPPTPGRAAKAKALPGMSCSVVLVCVSSFVVLWRVFRKCAWRGGWGCESWNPTRHHSPPPTKTTSTCNHKPNPPPLQTTTTTTTATATATTTTTRRTRGARTRKQTQPQPQPQPEQHDVKSVSRDPKPKVSNIALTPKPSPGSAVPEQVQVVLADEDRRFIAVPGGVSLRFLFYPESLSVSPGRTISRSSRRASLRPAVRLRFSWTMPPESMSFAAWARKSTCQRLWATRG